MKVFERYFEQNQIQKQLAFDKDTEVIVIIPVFNDPDIFDTIDSLCLCSTQEGKAGVVIVVNHSECLQEEIKEQNRQLAADLEKYVQTKQTVRIQFEVIRAFGLPVKYAGVGLARKIAMDVAVCFFYHLGKINAPILSLDADTWVDRNYLDATILFFKQHLVAGVSIAYEHRLDTSGITEAIRLAIVKYELYLRYYRLALEYTGHPYAFHCIGSAFAVRTIDYVSQGGMNKRQAGEDFYFLQKLIATGRYATLKSTVVYPSSRFSERTPFGTGRSIRQIVDDAGSFPVYNTLAFQELKRFFQDIFRLYKADDHLILAYFRQQSKGIQDFLTQINGIALLAETNANCASVDQFVKRFFDHFNAFRVLKYLNYIHETVYPKIEIHCAVNNLLTELNLPVTDEIEETLRILRKL